MNHLMISNFVKHLDHLIDLDLRTNQKRIFLDLGYMRHFLNFLAKLSILDKYFSLKHLLLLICVKIAINKLTDKEKIR